MATEKELPSKPLSTTKKIVAGFGLAFFALSALVLFGLALLVMDNMYKNIKP